MKFVLKFKDKEPTPEEEAIAIYKKYESSKPKKKKKKSKKKSTKSSIEFDEIVGNINTELFTFDEDDDQLETTVAGSKKSRKKSKIDPDTFEFYHKRFQDETDLYYKMLEQNIKFEIETKEFLDTLKKTGIRNVKAVSDMYSNVNTAKKTVLDTIKEISNIKKLASDLEQKMVRLKGPSKTDEKGPANSSQALMEVFKEIRDNISPQDDFFDPSAQYIDANTRYVDDEIEAEINRAESEGELEFTGAENNLVFAKDGIMPSIKILKNDETDEWKILAFDSYDNPIYDYEVPPKESLGKLYSVNRII